MIAGGLASCPPNAAPASRSFVALKAAVYLSPSIDYCSPFFLWAQAHDKTVECVLVLFAVASSLAWDDFSPVMVVIVFCV